MNPRIKELADKAEQLAAWITPQGLDCFNNFKEQFAKLLIAECLAQVDKTEAMLLDDSPEQALGATWAGFAIQKHFEVKT